MNWRWLTVWSLCLGCRANVKTDIKTEADTISVKFTPTDTKPADTKPADTKTLTKPSVPLVNTATVDIGTATVTANYSPEKRIADALTTHRNVNISNSGTGHSLTFIADPTAWMLLIVFTLHLIFLSGRGLSAIAQKASWLWIGLVLVVLAVLGYWYCTSLVQTSV